MAENEEGYAIRFTADFSQLRRELEAIKREIEQTVVTMKIAAGGTGGAAGTSAAVASAVSPAGRIAGLLGSEPAALTAEDGRTAARMASAAAGSERIERVAATADSPLRVYARRIINIPGMDMPFASAGGLGYGGPFSGGFGGAASAGPMGQWGSGYPMLPSEMGGVPAVGDPGFGGGEGLPPGVPPVINIPNGGSGGGGRGRWQGGRSRINWGRIAMLASVGYGVYTADRLVNADVQRNVGYALAGSDPLGQYQAETQFSNTISDIPILGGFAAFAVDPWGFGRAGNAVMAQSAQDTDAATGILRMTAAGRRGLSYGNQQSLAVNDYQRRRLGVERDYDPILGQQSRITELRKAELGAAQQTRDDALKQIRADFHADTPEDIYGAVNPETGGEIDAAGTDRRRADMRSRLQSVQDQYSAQISGINKKYDDLTENSSRAKQADLDAIDRDQMADRYASGVRTRSSLLRAAGDPDAAALEQVAGLGNAAWYRINPKDTQGRELSFQETQADLAAIQQAINKSGAIRELGILGSITANNALARGDTYSAGLANVLTGAAAGVVGTERIAEVPAALRQGLSSLMAFMGQHTLKAQDISAQAGATAMLASGDTFGFQRQQIQNRLTTQLRGASPGEAEGYRAQARSDTAVIDRSQNLFNLGLDTQLGVSQALNTGNQPGGYQQTAQALQVIGQAMERFIAASPQDRGTIGQTGLNLLGATRRDLQLSGTWQEIAPGTGGPGYGSSGDQSQAMQDLTNAINKLNTLLENRTDFGVGGDSGAGGDFGGLPGI